MKIGSLHHNRALNTQMIRKTYKYRLYPTKAQIMRLDETLALCCELYNAALQERRDAWRINREPVNYYTQSRQLPEIKSERTDLNQVYAQTLQDTLRRVDKTFKAFFGRVKRKVKAGFPRFRSSARYDSFSYPQGGFVLDTDKLKLSKIGKVKVKLHRPVEGKIKTLTIKREAGYWYACFSVECEAIPLPVCSESVGVDVGLRAFATLSNGSEIENPRHYKEAQAKLRRASRRVSRRKKGSHRRRKAVQLLARVHQHIRQQRADFHHKVSRSLVNKYGLIVVEDLNVKGLAAGMLAKSVNDAGWGMFLEKIAYKAENAGRQFFRVNPKGTSQRCVCGADNPKNLKDRWHECAGCGLSVSRDHASALEILRRGLRLQSVTCSVS